MNPNFFVYSQWLWASHWDFFEHLFSNYDIIAKNDAHILWRYNDKQTEKNASSTEITAVGNKYYLPRNESNDTIIYTLDASYEATSNLPLSALTKYQKYLINFEGASAMRYAASLPPNETTWRIPITVRPGERAAIEPQDSGIIPTASLNLSKVRYKKLDMSQDNINHLYGQKARE